MKCFSPVPAWPVVQRKNGYVPLGCGHEWGSNAVCGASAAAALAVRVTSSLPAWCCMQVRLWNLDSAECTVTLQGHKV